MFPSPVARNSAKALLTCCLVLATTSLNGAAEGREGSGAIELADRHAETSPVQLAQTDASISEAIKFWHVNNVDFAYTDGSKPYFEIIEDKSKFLWDPTDQIYTPAADAWRKLQLKKIRNSFPPGGQPLMLDAQTEIVWRQDPMDTNFTDYFEIASNGQSLGDFYLLVDLGNDHVSNRFCCDNRVTPVETVRQKYGTVINLGAVKLDTGLILLSAASNGSVYFIGLRNIPATPVKFSNDVFLIPRPSLAPALQDAGLSMHARYAAVLRVMAEARQVKQSPIGQLVKADKFVSAQRRGRL